MPTGVAGLDLVLNGGLEPGAVVVVAGSPGTGKTILAQQMCFAAAAAGHKSVFYTTMSEPHTKLVRNLEQFAFFDPKELGARVEHIHLGDFLRPARPDGLEPLVYEIIRKTLADEPAIAVVDSTKMLRDFADERALRSALYDLTGHFSSTSTTLLLLGEYTPEELLSGIEFSLADGIIQLEYEPREPLDKRWMRIMKMRGGDHRPGKHTFRIDTDGIEVFPRIETLAPAGMALIPDRIRSGIPGLDELMNGGMRRTDASLVFGPSGVGKTIFGLRWAAQGLEQGEHCLFVSFQDSPDQLIRFASEFGWDAAAALDSGQLVIVHVPMGDLDLDGLASAVRAELRRRPVSRTVIDSLAEMVFANRESERFPAYKRSLIGLIKAAGSSLLVTSETTIYGITGQTPDGLMFLFDNAIALRYIERGSEVGRVLNVVKMRNSSHATTLSNFTITDRGPTVGDTFKGVTGRLGWSALRTEDSPDPGYAPLGS
jgi:circadian clock protein KaiC